jgi:hypothetical protein
MIFRCAGALDREHKEVARVVVGRRDQGLGQVRLIGSPIDVDIRRGPRPLSQAQVESETALQQPSAGRNCKETSEKAFEDDALAVPSEAGAVSLGVGLETLFKRLAERRGVRVPHPGTSPTARSMNLRARAECDEAATWMRFGVVSPRPSAWRTAISICSGCAPASSASTMLRSGVVTGTPATVRTSGGPGGRSSV